MKRGIILMVFFIVVGGTAFAQSSKKKKKSREEDQNMPTSVSPNTPQKDYAPKKKKKIDGPTFESDEEYRERMEAVVKQKIKNERLMQNPQYSDPMYFGHKRPPKKHKPGKMKYCKVCGIRH